MNEYTNKTVKMRRSQPTRQARTTHRNSNSNSNSNNNNNNNNNINNNNHSATNVIGVNQFTASSSSMSYLAGQDHGNAKHGNNTNMDAYGRMNHWSYTNGANSTMASNNSFYPGLAAFTDTMDALPLELIRHFTLLREVDAKACGPEQLLRQHIKEAMDLPKPLHASGFDHALARLQSGEIYEQERLHFTNGAAQDSTNQDLAEMSRRSKMHQVRLVISELLLTLDEKIHVISTASEALHKHLSRVDDAYRTVQQEIPPTIRDGNPDHWAYRSSSPRESLAQRQSHQNEGNNHDSINTSNYTANVNVMSSDSHQHHPLHSMNLHTGSNAGNHPTSGNAAYGIFPSLTGTGGARGESRREAGAKRQAHNTYTMDYDNSHPTHDVTGGYATSSGRRSQPTAKAMRDWMEPNVPHSGIHQYRGSPLPDGAFGSHTSVQQQPPPPKKRKTVNHSIATNTASTHLNKSRDPTPAMNATTGNQPARKKQNETPDNVTTQNRPITATVKRTKNANTATKSPASPLIVLKEKPIPHSQALPAFSLSGNGVEETISSQLQNKQSARSKPKSSVTADEPILRPIPHPDTGSAPKSTKVDEPINPTPAVLQMPMEMTKKYETAKSNEQTSKPHHEKRSSISSLPVKDKQHTQVTNSTSIEANPTRSRDVAKKKEERTNHNLVSTGPQREDTKSSAHGSRKSSLAAAALHQGTTTDPAMVDVAKKEPKPLENEDDGAEQDEEQDEMRYCYCNQVSYGKMVACDGPACKKEWFHLPCIDLTHMPGPKEKWYCNECIATATKSGRPLPTR